MGQLDKTDVEILQVLQKDAKVNTKELSEKLHISKTPIYERIKRLENDGYIKGYVALADNKNVGKLTKVHGIVKIQSSFVLSEMKHTTVLNIDR